MVHSGIFADLKTLLRTPAMTPPPFPSIFSISSCVPPVRARKVRFRHRSHAPPLAPCRGKVAPPSACAPRMYLESAQVAHEQTRKRENENFYRKKRIEQFDLISAICHRRLHQQVKKRHQLNSTTTQENATAKLYLNEHISNVDDVIYMNETHWMGNKRAQAQRHANVIHMRIVERW